MKISILAPDLSENCLGRSYLLAKILQRQYEVEIAGPIFGDGVWQPVVEDQSITYKSIRLSKGLKPYRQILDLVKLIDGDILLASKPLLTSFGVGLLKKIARKRPLILDIDDWQMGFIKDRYNQLTARSYLHAMITSALLIYKVPSFWNNLMGEKMHALADEMIVSNTFLKNKFGGTIVWHGRDTVAFDPQKFDPEQIRKKYGIDQAQKIVMFFGTPRPYKGLDDLIKAVQLVGDPDVRLVIVGIDFNCQYCAEMVKLAKKCLGKNFSGFGFRPYKTIPEFLAMADVVVVPQKRNYATLGQVPAKIFDAMAMAKPIIATAVSDLPGILDDCGWVVNPENLAALGKAIQHVFANPVEAGEMGLKARQKCVANYSWTALEAVLVGIIGKYAK